jgi:hypothetical protein
MWAEIPMLRTFDKSHVALAIFLSSQGTRVPDKKWICPRVLKYFGLT